MDTFQLAVAHNLCIGVIDLQTSEQRDEGCTLGRSTSVGRTTTFVEASFVTDADGVGIIMSGMGADHLFWTTLMKLAVTGDVVVVAAAVPAFGTVHLVKPFETQMLVRPARRTVNHNQIYSSHSLQV